MRRDSPTIQYLLVWAALLGLLATTVAVSFFPLGRLNAVVAITIAAIKVSLIGAYFMHLRKSPRLVWIVAGTGLVWLGILFALTFGDYQTRRYLPAPVVWQP